MSLDDLLTSLTLAEEEGDNDNRKQCPDCERPARVCWCPYLPSPPLAPGSTRILILQHPNEAKRHIRTARMAQLGLAKTHCQVLIGRKFSSSLEVFVNDTLGQVLEQPTTFILYPSEEAQDVKEVVVESTNKSPLTFIILDGSWDEARKLYSWNPLLKSVRKSVLSVQTKSAYVVRTQPADQCLSTIESAAHTLAIVQDDPTLVDQLLAPLHAMCNFQVNHGAVTHDSKAFKHQNNSFVKRNNFKKKKKSNKI